jgi:hypothetical protein
MVFASSCAVIMQVRDDGKGGQLIKAKCGSDVCLQLVDKATGMPLVLPDVRLKLYVVNGQQLAASGPGEAPAGLYLSDDGHPLFAAAGVLPEDDKGVLIEVTQVGGACLKHLTALHGTCLIAGAW